MGFLDKVINGVNRAAEPIQDLQYPTDPRLAAADRIATSGEPVGGTIVGIDRRLNDTEEHCFAVLAADGVRYGIQAQMAAAGMTRLRLGLAVALRRDGDDAVFDPAALAEAWRVDLGGVAQRRLRSAPADGVVDGALDARVQSRLKKWTPSTGTITGHERRSALGMPSMNWDVRVGLAVGGEAVAERDAVPPYVQWHTAPGTEVRVVVDPKDPTRCAVDWPALANARGAPAPLEERPPHGSIAASLSVPPPPSPAPAGPNTAAADATFAQWLEGVRGGQMKRKAFDQGVAEWEAAGLCTPEQAAAARRAVDG